MKNSVKLSIALLLASLSFSASALTISAINTSTGTGTLLTSALLAQNSGIAITKIIDYRGTNNSDIQQSGTYSGLALAPAHGDAPTLAMGDGVLLTTGSANIAGSNTENNSSMSTGSGADARLAALYGAGPVHDANVLEFNFTVGAGVTWISAQFMFGSEEYPTQNYADIFGFFVDGVNYATFPDGSAISNVPGGNNFIANQVDEAGISRFGVEYNGLTRVYTITGLLAAGQDTHTIKIGIADTGDATFDSGVFVSSLQAGAAAGDVPEPGTVLLLGLGLAGVALMRRRAQRR